jgi:Ca2+-transporting ATPase
LNEFPAENGARRILVKGASERVADYCARVMVNDEVVPLDEPWRERIDAAQDEMRANGLRVLAGAWRDVDAGAQEIHNGDVTRDLVFAGLWGLMDPPRPEAAEAIGRAQGAGMRIIMMTGDHAETASAIARQVGIATGDGQAVTGERLEAMGDEELVEALKETSVFARVSPAHKVRVTQALQAQDEVVAMTGDGVNDAAALKRASIGVAMGQKGTEVAKEAADMVLQDDNFATIIAAVEEGRLIFSNLRRVIFFLIATNIGEILTLSTGLVLGWDLPLTAVMILWVNLLTEGACTVPLGVEPSHRDHLKDPPRRPGEGILDLVTARRVAILAPIMAAGTLLLFHFRKGEGLDYARTCAFTALAAFQWFQAFNARSRYRSAFAFPLWSNRYLLIGLSIAIVLQVCTVYVPFMQTAFDTEPLRIWDWALAIGVASSILAADEILKLFHVHGREGQRAE